MKNVVIIGAGGHGKVVADIVAACGDNLIGFLDDSSDDERVIGGIGSFGMYQDARFIVAIGNSEARKEIVSRLDGVSWYTAIHPSAVVSPSAKIGEGSVVCPNAVINAGAVIGKHCIINTASVVEHDNTIGDWCHISVGAKLGGTVKIGDCTWVGIGATVINNISVCAGTLIGAGAVVVKDITEPGTYIGIPARKKYENTYSC